MAPRSAPQYPDPFIVPPKSGRHHQTFVVLHGRGSNGEFFGRELLRTPIPSFGTLQEAFPDAKFVFPTAAKRRAVIYNRSMIHQWFDNGSLQTPTEAEERQYDGFRESSAFIHGLLQSEIELVGGSNVILWGLSQGLAMSLIALLLWQGPKIAAVIGMCGWLPLRQRMTDAVAENVTQDPDDPFARESDDSATRSNFSKAVEYLTDELDLPTMSSPSLGPQIPIFLGHGTEDEKVPIHLDREAVELLKLVEVDVEYHEYEGLGHWYSEDMLRDILLFVRAKTEWPIVES